jgi:hypothetical protein
VQALSCQGVRAAVPETCRGLGMGLETATREAPRHCARLSCVANSSVEMDDHRTLIDIPHSHRSLMSTLARGKRAS